jgi:hypothetical protein
VSVLIADKTTKKINSTSKKDLALKFTIFLRKKRYFGKILFPEK